MKQYFREERCGGCGGSGHSIPPSQPYSQLPPMLSACPTCHGEGVQMVKVTIEDILEDIRQCLTR